MKLLVAADAHIYKTKDGKYWTPKIYGYNFWTRYLSVFENVRIVARLKETEIFSEKWIRVDGPNVEVYGIPFYQGPIQLLMKYFSIQKSLKHVADGCQAAVIRMPSQTAYMTYKKIKNKIPIAGEIVYDPTDDVNDKSNNYIMQLLNKRISKQLSLFCKSVKGVSYVTEHTIQKHYPSGARLNGSDNGFFESYYSTITLKEEAFTNPRHFENKDSITTVMSDVSMNSERKGERTLITAVKIAKEKGYKVNAIIIGDGSKKEEFMKLAVEYGVEKQVKFTGLLPSSDAVRKEMLSADVFVFPTKAEGLPRGILEAMAIGMPVLSSPVGGIPEILDQECLFDPLDANAYAEELCHFIDNPKEMDKLSERNFRKSQEFKNEILQVRRNEFYRKLRNISE